MKCINQITSTKKINHRRQKNVNLFFSFSLFFLQFLIIVIGVFSRKYFSFLFDLFSPNEFLFQSILNYSRVTMINFSIIFPCRENRDDFDDFEKNRRKIVINRIS